MRGAFLPIRVDDGEEHELTNDFTLVAQWIKDLSEPAFCLSARRRVMRMEKWCPMTTMRSQMKAA